MQVRAATNPLEAHSASSIRRDAATYSSASLIAPPAVPKAPANVIVPVSRMQKLGNWEVREKRKGSGMVGEDGWKIEYINEVRAKRKSASRDNIVWQYRCRVPRCV